MSLITTENLTKIYGSGDTAVTALDHVNLKVNPGEFVAVMGPSGCGKSTLLHLVGGLDRPSDGKVVIEEASLAEMKDDDLTRLRRKHIGFVFQFYNLIPVPPWIGLAIIVGLGGMTSSLTGKLDSVIHKSLGSDYLFILPSVSVWNATWVPARISYNDCKPSQVSGTSAQCVLPIVWSTARRSPCWASTR